MPESILPVDRCVTVRRRCRLTYRDTLQIRFGHIDRRAEDAPAADAQKSFELCRRFPGV
jgi:hypothetical protein